MSCRSAAVRFLPSSSTGVSKPAGASRACRRHRRPRGLLDVGACRVGHRVGDVGGDGAAEHERVLRYHAESRRERVQDHVAEIDAVDAHAAGGRVVGAGEELGDARLAGSRVAHQRRDRPRGNRERHVVEHRSLDERVRERHVIEGHVTAQFGAGDGVRADRGEDRLLEGLAETAPRHPHLEQGAVELADLTQRRRGRGHQQVDGQCGADGQGALEGERSRTPEHERLAHGRDEDEHLRAHRLDAERVGLGAAALPAQRRRTSWSGCRLRRGCGSRAGRRSPPRTSR